jgi:hypothetical protein
MKLRDILYSDTAFEECSPIQIASRKGEPDIKLNFTTALNPNNECKELHREYSEIKKRRNKE